MWIRQLGAGRRRPLRPGPDGDHLHGRRGGGLRLQLAGRPVYLPAACRSSAARMFTVGASAPIFGLLGALVYYGRRTGNATSARPACSTRCSSASSAYLSRGGQLGPRGGFVGGFLAALLLDPLKPERVDHLVVAAACLLVTVVALVASFVTALPLPDAADRVESGFLNPDTPRSRSPSVRDAGDGLLPRPVRLHELRRLGAQNGLRSSLRPSGARFPERLVAIRPTNGTLVPDLRTERDIR